MILELAVKCITHLGYPGSLMPACALCLPAVVSTSARGIATRPDLMSAMGQGTPSKYDMCNTALVNQNRKQ
jgi:hypothetical protein